MRRRSNRSIKATEEPAEVVSPKKTKRHSRRRKQSSSESDDEPISTLMDKTTDKEAGDNEHCQSEVWKVAPGPQATTEGEIVKLKICLKRPPTSPEKQKRAHKKSASHHDDELPEGKGTRRSSRRGKSNIEEEIHTEDEEQEDIDDKGKFKDKSISKTEKLNDSDPCNDEKSQNTQSDDNISDNVQIEPQCVQSDNINKLAGKESQDIEIEQQETMYQVQEEDSTAMVPIQNTGRIVEIIEDVVVVEATIQSEAESKSAITSDNSNESTSHITPPIPLQTEQILISTEESEKTQQQQDQEDATETFKEIVENKNESNISQCSNAMKNTIDDVSQAEQVKNSYELPSQENYSNNSMSISLDKDKEDDKSDSLNVPRDELIKIRDEQQGVSMQIPSPPRNIVCPKSRIIKSIKEAKELTTLELDIPMYVAPPPRVCVYPKSMMAKNVEKAEVKSKSEPPRLALMKLPKLATERKRKWGQTANTKAKLPALNFVTSNLIAEIYPNCKLLDEDKVKLDLIKNSSSSATKLMTKEKRKISIEMPKSPQAGPTSIKSETSSSKENETSKDGIFSHMTSNERENADQASIIALNRKISIVEDTAAKLKPPPNPAKNPVSAVLYISNLVRPFTLKQLKELLERTGKIVDGGFWTDRIKSKCYAQYESIEDAETTRNALHGVNWPIGNGKKLMIEFSTLEEFELARNPPPPIPDQLKPENKITETPEPSEKENKEPARRSGAAEGDDHRNRHEREHRIKEPEVRHHQEHRNRRDSGGGRNGQEQQQPSSHVREWDVGKGEEMRHSRSRSRDRGDRRGAHHSHSRSRRSPSPREYDRYKPHPKVDEPPPQKLMDDLFLKTKATPCIYWQALTPEEIALKQQQRLERMAEHQRRLQQTTNSGGLGSGGAYAGPAPQQYRSGGYVGSYGGSGRRRY